jgi:uncharacterized protein (DUF2345 family)
MNRLPKSRRLPITLGSLTLLALPIGCGSETHTTAEVPAPPTVVIETAPAPFHDPYDVPAPLDQAVQRSAGDLKAEAHHDATDTRKEAREAEGDVKKTVDDAEGEAKTKAKEIEAEARKSAEDALDKLLPPPK